MPTVSSQAFELLVLDVSGDDDDTSFSAASGCDFKLEGEEDCNKVEWELALSKVEFAACPELPCDCCTLLF